MANQQILFAARAAGVLPLGFVGSIADYSDPASFRLMIERAKGIGFRGGFCVHPSQIDIMNKAFSPSVEEVANARMILSVYQQALSEGKGATQNDGIMIDVPVAARAEETIRTAEAIERK